MAYRVVKGKEDLDIYGSTKVSLKDATQKELKELYENHKDLIELVDEPKKSKKKDSE